MNIAENVVRFSYDVIVEEDQITKDEEGRYTLTEEGKEQAFEMLLEGVSDTGGGWYPRYEVLCMSDFMAGQICEREKGHEGPHE